MRNLRLDLAYDGTEFYGWQIQPHKPTIQGAIEAAVERITGERAAVAGAGRTDAGVHAAGQVACFRTNTLIPCENLNRALNNILPREIRVLRVCEAPAAFHARYAAVAKLYRYRILQSNVCPPFLARFVYHTPVRLDAERMMRAAKCFEGEHDFTSFAATEPCRAKPQKTGRRSAPRSAVRRISFSRVFWRPETSILTYDVRGNGFLHHMVRNLVGTLIEVGRDAIPPDAIPAILSARRRPEAGPTAPAHGLCLVRVEYPPTPEFKNCDLD
ncbi:MAG: tRNA pseudouridine(38-40) synthase TruA [Terriglobia bacterium]